MPAKGLDAKIRRKVKSLSEAEAKELLSELLLCYTSGLEFLTSVEILSNFVDILEEKGVLNRKDLM